MRKIYSLVLMTAMLFVGANAWATPIQVSTSEQFVNAWNTAASNVEIQLTGDFTLASPMWLGTQNLSDASRTITLDLNGQILTVSATYGFFVTHGSLIVKDSQAVTGRGKISHTKAGDLFVLCGSTNKDVNPKTAISGYFTYLKIEQGVKIDASSAQNAITIDCLENQLQGNKKSTHQDSYYTSHGVPTATGIAYYTNVYDKAQATTSSKVNRYGVAHGVRVDIHGSIEAKKYAIKSNGNLRSPSDYIGVEGLPRTSNNNPANFSGYAIEATDVNYSPFIHIYSTASMIASAGNDASKKPVAVYASGYARWLIEGACSGNVGVYVKSGEIDINDAVIESTGTAYTAASATNSGVTATGSAIVIESNAVYSGDIDVEISGDTKVSATNGYAIDEAVTSANDTKVDAITITGGTFDGGTVPNPDYDPADPESPQTVQGTINISEKTADANADDNKDTEVTIAGGNMEGTVTLGDGTHDLDEVVKPTEGEENVHVTYVDNGNGGTTMVISAGEAPGDVTNWATVNNGDDVNWKGFSVVTIADGTTLTLGELQLNSADGTTGKEEQKLIIEDNAVLTVDRLIMNSYARLVVDAGGKLIVKGEQGINAPVVENILLKANGTNQALFVISPNVASNRQPNASIEFTTKAYQKTATTWQWERFATPVTKTTRPDNNSEDFDPSIAYVDGDTELGTYADYLDDATQTWKHATAWSDLRPFHACAITNNVPSGVKITYTFKGQLLGNVVDSISRKASHWNYYGNSYMAPMSVKALLTSLSTQSEISNTVYTWKIGADRYTLINNVYLQEFADPEDWYIPSLGFFVTKNASGVAGAFDIDYAKTIYDYAINPASYNTLAPAREGNTNKVRINIVSETGARDYICVLEGDMYNADFEDGVDAEKIMGNGMNFYVSDEDASYAMVATDEIVGTLLSLQTSEDINYTLSFDKVNGEVYALRDNMTNTVVLMNEGATYNFTAQPNATLEGRFQIVSRQEMPTAVETIEETVAPKAIYTIMGQYVGETTDWNNLPAGVYVVDGVKVIK